MTKISVIIPVLNGYEMTKNIIDNIESIFAHTYEIIVVDDCSTDETTELKNDNRVRYIRNDERLGVNKSRNKGIKEAKGEYILVINNDIILQS
jgi:glycosyltransferase involved in cell wall biosynthesis